METIYDDVNWGERERIANALKEFPDMGSNILDEYAPKRGALQIPAQVNYLNEIKVLVRTMPYGDFIEMATAIGADHTKMWEWANS